MNREYLPATARERIRDLMSERKMTVKQLADIVKCNETTLGRYLNGETDKVSDQWLIAIAREFCVSVDFLLGETDVPEKLDFELADLGLSVQAARNLYSGKVNTDAVNLLLENERFAMLTTLLAHYFDDTFSAGYEIQDQIYKMTASMLLGIGSKAARNVANAINLQRIPTVKSEINAIEETFAAAVKEIKEQRTANVQEQGKACAEVLAQFRKELAKGKNMKKLHKLTEADIVQAIANVTANAEGLDNVQRSQIIDGLTPVFHTMASGVSAHGKTDQ